MIWLSESDEAEGWMVMRSRRMDILLYEETEAGR